MRRCLYFFSDWSGSRARNRRWGRKLRLFVAGCALHTAVDFLTHVDDGPLYAFPLDWQSRLRAPVSYWDPAHHGRSVRLLEHLLDLLLLLVIMRKLRGYGFMQRTEDHRGMRERREINNKKSLWSSFFSVVLCVP
jgi:hypothetical protein